MRFCFESAVCMNSNPPTLDKFFLVVQQILGNTGAYRNLLFGNVRCTEVQTIMFAAHACSSFLVRIVAGCTAFSEGSNTKLASRKFTEGVGILRICVTA